MGYAQGCEKHRAAKISAYLRALSRSIDKWHHPRSMGTDHAKILTRSETFLVEINRQWTLIRKGTEGDVVLERW